MTDLATRLHIARLGPLTRSDIARVQEQVDWMAEAMEFNEECRKDWRAWMRILFHLQDLMRDERERDA